MEDRDSAGSVDPIWGDKLYQKRARRTLPLLVRQARAHQEITYSDIAIELGMPNPRNLNYVLGSIHESLKELAHEWGKRIPPIQCLVVGKTTHMPGFGFDNILGETHCEPSLSRRERKAWINHLMAEAYSYPRWDAVLDALGLQSAPATPLSKPDEIASRGGSGGEGAAHLALKAFVSLNPRAIGLSSSLAPGATEFTLPSGDSLDVLFVHSDVWHPVEVKARHSDQKDMERGLFQCVKYRAVIDAWQAYESNPVDVDAVLVLEKALPAELVRLKNELGVRVVENVALPKE